MKSAAARARWPALPDTSTGHYTAQLNLYWEMVKRELSDPPPPCLGLYLAQFYEDDLVNCFAVPTDAALAEGLLAEERLANIPPPCKPAIAAKTTSVKTIEQ